MDKKIFVGIIIMLFFFSSIFPSISGHNNSNDYEITDRVYPDINIDETVSVTFYTFEKNRIKNHEIELSTIDSDLIYEQFEQLKLEMINHPLDEYTQILKQEFIDLLEAKGLIPDDLSKDIVDSLLNPSWFNEIKVSGDDSTKKPLPLANSNRASALFCSIVSGGAGWIVPPIMIPRPRIVNAWLSFDGYTAVAALYTLRGFYAHGSHIGLSFGFIGIGLSFAIPGVPPVYGFAGYSLLTTVIGDSIELYPPNSAPDISDEYPSNGATNIPTLISELSFRIFDAELELMNYRVTTYPNIGTATESNKPGGLYSVPVSNLQGSTEYSWDVEVSDGNQWITETYTFTTASEEPVISNPSPNDKENYVPVDISELSIVLTDYQNDPMDYTIETTPNIGSTSDTDVSNGQYALPINDLTHDTQYTWYVNVTDGTYWTRKIFTFTTELEMEFNPFSKGWQYRKNITIDHLKVTDDQTSFPVLISIIDDDLHEKAQEDGEDILFMDDTGVATRLYHEIEYFDDSTGELVAWVNIPYLSSIDNTHIYLYYGNPDCNSQQISAKVWDEEYYMVHHMNDNPDNSHIIDSTDNDNDGTKKGYNEPIETGGQIGRAQLFDGTNDYIDATEFDINDDFTISCWVNPSLREIGQSFIGKHSSKRDNIILTGFWAEGYSVHMRDDSHQDGVQTTGWQHIVLVGEKTGSSATLISVYKDGIILWQHELNNIIGNAFGEAWTIGQDWDSSGRTNFLSGIIDEVRVIDGIKTPSWVITEYNNQFDPSNFIDIGPEESTP